MRKKTNCGRIQTTFLYHIKLALVRIEVFFLNSTFIICEKKLGFWESELIHRLVKLDQLFFSLKTIAVISWEIFFEIKTMNEEISRRPTPYSVSIFHLSQYAGETLVVYC